MTQKRACLTLGALSKHLKDLGDDSEAQKIVEKFERWLGIHNESMYLTKRFKSKLKPSLFKCPKLLKAHVCL